MFVIVKSGDTVWPNVGGGWEVWSIGCMVVGRLVRTLNYNF